MRMRVASASRAFSRSSFTTDAGRSTTSPAAILLATASERTWILPMRFSAGPWSVSQMTTGKVKRAQVSCLTNYGRNFSSRLPQTGWTCRKCRRALARFVGVRHTATRSPQAGNRSATAAISPVARRQLDERSQRPELLQRPLPHVFSVQPERRVLGNDALGACDEPRYDPLAARAHCARAHAGWIRSRWSLQRQRGYGWQYTDSDLHGCSAARVSLRDHSR